MICDSLRSCFEDGGEGGWKGHFGKEIRGAVERGGTRAFADADRQREEPGKAAAEGAHSIEGRRVGGWGRLERQPDHHGLGPRVFNNLRGAQATGGRGLRSGAEPQAPHDAAGGCDFRRREGSQADRAGVLQAAQGSCPLDIAPAGEQGRGTRHCRACQRLDDRTHAQKNALKPHRRQCWVIPPKANSAFVAAMEDVLAGDTRPRDPDYPRVCLDETTKQLIAETRTPIPIKRGRAARVDYEYERNGTANLFMLFAPLEGWRHVEVTDRHTAIDAARVLKECADRNFPYAKTIVLVQDNLNIHSTASLYEAFPAAEARRLVERFEWHDTPKHGSWLDPAESELGVLSTQLRSGRCRTPRTPRTGEPATWGSGQRWLDCSWATWAPYNGRYGLLFNEKISRPWKRNLSK